ncbi:MAG: hypothetical protein CMD31_09100 [Flavobacteriales bacterium]|nr:hypothetical protein [Flavobacteriales bacterium]|tara:strand:- start:30606 stop:36263 length:5658 start_codon:yes stop_codon:yes gene_type:complete
MFKFKAYGISLLLTIVTTIAFSQSVITLDQPEFGNQTHRATEKIYLQSGYSYVPSGSDKMRAYISSIFNFSVDASTVGQDFTTYYISGMGVGGDFFMQTTDTFELSALDTNKLVTINFADTNQVNAVAISITFNENNQIETAFALITDETDSYEYSIIPYLSLEGDNIIFDLSELVTNHVSKCFQYNDYHWVSNKSYDENGVVIDEGITYTDNIGRSIQSQVRNFSTNKIMATEKIYDSFGRLAISTLSAPIYSGAFCYKPTFITANSGDPYDASKFDLPNTSSALSGEIDNPYAVDATTKGTLGWYFSNDNDEEPYVATSGFPYSRVEYYSDPLGRPKRMAGISENYKMGSGHETTVFYGTAGYELDYVYGVNFSNNKNLTKTITIDADGLEQVTYTDALENVIATCYSGIDNDCMNVPVKHDLDYYKGRSVSIHLPHFTGQQLYFRLNISRSCSLISFVEIKITDLLTGVELIEGTDFQVAGNGAITFNPPYSGKSLYLKLSYDYTSNYINNVYPVRNRGPYLPYQSFSYMIDYSHWALNYYDNKGLLIKNIPPEGVDCSGIDPSIGYNYETDWVNYDFYDEVLESYTIDPISVNDYVYNYDEYNTTTSSIYTHANTQTHNIDISFYPMLNPINYDGGCSSGGNYTDPSGVDDNIESGRLVNTMLDFLERTSSYNNSRVITSEDTSGIDTLLFTNQRTPVLVRDGNIIGTENFIVDNYYGGNAAYVPGGDPCDGHCFNGVQDCGETGIDEGDNCTVNPPGPCENNPPKLFATFKMELELMISDGTNTMFVKSDGSVQPGSYSYFFYPQIYKTCNCEYYWDYSSFTQPNVIIPDGVLNDYNQDIYVNLKSIEVRKNNTSNAYEVFDDNDWVHNFAQFMQIWVRLKHNTGPKVDDDISHSMETTYEYDVLNQLVKTTTPDAGITENVYDIQGNVRFSQDAQQEIDEKFSYVNYDRAGRPIESGVFDYSNSAALQFQNQDELPALNPGETSVLTVVDEIDGLNDTYCSEQTFTLYDLPDENTSPYYPFNTAPYTNYKQKHLLGRVSKIWNENSIMWYSYDMYGRVVWTIEYIIDAAIADYKTIDYEYDAAGNVTKTIYQKYETEYFEHRYAYNNGQQLIKVETSTDGLTYDQQANYSYYQHGGLKRTEVGDKLQGIDYLYTIDGKLKAINSPNLGIESGNPTFSDPGLDGEGTSLFYTDIFGMTIDYHTADYIRAGTFVNYGLGTNEKYSGTINQIRWNTDEPTLGLDLTSSGKQNVYQYSYNDFNWITGATFGDYTHSCNHNNNYVYNCPFPPTFDADANNQFKISGITYDKNGNIETFVRNGNSTTGISMDDLDYHYATTTQPDNDVVKINNRLTYVTDAVGSSGYTTDIENQSAANYTYNAIGEAIASVGDDETYTYYQNGLPKEIKATSTGYLKLKFEYNVLGQRLKKTIYDGSGNADKEIFYVTDIGGNLISTYERDVTTSNIIQDYSITGTKLIGMYDPDTEESRYFIYDHLGNVRATFRENMGAIELLSVSDFYPFGMVMPGRNAISTLDKLNLSYQGKELDQTGFHHFGSRQWDARLGRWITTDPANQFYSPYLGMGNIPVTMIDPNGELAWFIPVIIGAYIGGSLANGSYNPGSWDFGSKKTWGYMAAGAFVGGVSGGFATGLASSGMPFANTAAIAGGSLFNSIGTFAYTQGSSDVSVSLGIASYNFSQNDWGYLGEKGNSGFDNAGYSLGAVGNFSDVITLSDKLRAANRTPSNYSEEELKQIYDEATNTKLNQKLNSEPGLANYAGNSPSGGISPHKFRFYKDLGILDGRDGQFGGFAHDLAYFENGADGIRGVLFNTNVTSADYSLIRGMSQIIRSGSYNQNVIQSARLIRTAFQVTTTLKSSYYYNFYFINH